MARVKCPKCFTVNPDGQERCVQCSAPLPRIRIQGQAPGAPRAPLPGQAPPPQLSPGQAFAGRYTILQLIGRGGMGSIYRVRDNTLGEEVALKTLLPQFARDKMVVERFFNEARIARKLAHPSIVRVHDIGAADGIVYISMEFVRGQSLRNLMERLPSGDRLPAAEILRIAEDLCTALEYAHQYTIHRDIKPENIMVDEKGCVKLMDFGISKLMANTRMTGASVVMGTPFYMSPEQLRNSHDVDARADVFSLGVVLYETLTGCVPTGVPKPPSVVVPGLPRRLDEIVGKCVEPDPAKRYQNAAELRADLRAIRLEMTQGPALVAPVTTKHQRGVSGAVIGWVLTSLCLATTAGLLYAAEQRRAAMPAAVPAQGVESVPVAAGGVEGLLQLARRAKARAGAPSDPVIRGILEDADQHLAAAEAGRNEDEAAAALRGYVAALMAPRLPDMVYIPQGTDTSGALVPAFFVDKTEVSNGEFSMFCEAVRWRSPCISVPEYASLPVTNVTTYDAIAYAASKGKLLPTAQQWTRAAQTDGARRFPWDGEFALDRCHCEAPGPVDEPRDDVTPRGVTNLLGNVAEWTRTSVDWDGAPDFGHAVVIRGGSFNNATGLDAADALAYGTFRDDVGFRCVKEIPINQEAVERLL
jgi:tRNA A-37 threonylcarbamoyl transferase component Bud32